MEYDSPEDLRVFREKARTFRGSYKIHLDEFVLEDIPDAPLQEAPEEEGILLDGFIGSDRLLPDMYVRVLIPTADAPQANGCNDLSYREPEFFNSQEPLLCIYGQSRIEAARRYLSEEDGRWWVANLFEDDVDDRTRYALQTQGPRPIKYFEGEIYRQIRIFELEKDFDRKNALLSKLSPEKQRIVLRMETSTAVSMVRKRLDALIPFRGFWSAPRLGSWKRIFDIHCPEEMEHGLGIIEQVWTRIVGGSKEDQNKLGIKDVAILQGRCPSQSLVDRAYIKANFEAMLTHIRSPDQRRALLNRILSEQVMIPSLYTFQEGIKCLEQGARILKQVLPTPSRGSLSNAFCELHNNQNTFQEQTSEFTYLQKATATGSEAEWFAYRSLWLNILRHLPKPRKDTSLRKEVGHTTALGKRKRSGRRQIPGPLGNSRPLFEQKWLPSLAAFASANGYRDMQHADCQRISDAAMAQSFLRNVRPPRYYNLGRLDQKVDSICRILEDIREAELLARVPEITSDCDDGGPDIRDRCGIPQERSVNNDEKHLFLKYVYPRPTEVVPKKYLTSFGWKREMFHFFFGTPSDRMQDLPAQQETSRGPPGDQAEPSRDGTGSKMPNSAPRRNQEPVSGHSRKGNNARTQMSADHAPLQSPTHQRAGTRKHGIQNITYVGIAEASRLLRTAQPRSSQKLIVLTPSSGERFRVQCVDPNDRTATAAALKLDNRLHQIWARNHSRIKLTYSKTIVKEAQLSTLDETKYVLVTLIGGDSKVVNEINSMQL